MALEIKLQMEHCMPVIHSVRVDFNIPGPHTQPRNRGNKTPLRKWCWSPGIATPLHSVARPSTSGSSACQAISPISSTFHGFCFKDHRLDATSHLQLLQQSPTAGTQSCHIRLSSQPQWYQVASLFTSICITYCTGGLKQTPKLS